MGRMVDGRWTTEWYEPDEEGRFVRPPTRFRDRVSADGSTDFPAAPGRYHLYVSLACPWAHRTLILRELEGLTEVLPVSVVHPLMLEEGWEFGEYPGATPDPVLGARYLREVYAAADPRYTGRVTVPVLWDRETGTIVNNESREIARMLETAFDEWGRADVNFCPPDLEEEVDRHIDAIYGPVNNGVYRAGFATSQEAYDEAVEELFEALDHWDSVLADRRYLLGDRITEADWFLFTTLLRFDPVYVGHFKCNLRRIADFPHLGPYLRDLYQVPGVAGTCDLDHIKTHYFGSHRHLNPSGIVPRGPLLELDRPHGREAVGRGGPRDAR